ncbi:autotransporter outer membrane beta-barrel domain-containing protein [Polynucleobacter sp. UB-Tiil-W10]|uniref:autotransporter outer membrane beta-barrel domain-containing protein n=1 Tax=Polynucleobacter sp. UB-Tiil-W10 TaxID=1855648 RepID=UPI001C0B2BE4|nr:autotransporter outer membrane beta-barrel domain-containing protein [Polynucleobacter sp. UB-Tiil-W10]MBU3539856.1 autotransporter outer membrane beta-barrel domain-containing protein [Polynucleobacter sp. UB-Tiil-W10]
MTAVFIKNNVCVSVGGRYTYSGPSPSANQQAGLVVLGYKPSPNLRVGAFADQTISVATPSGFSQSNNSPMWGLFAKWHMNPDETGWGVQASGVASNSTLSITRPLLANTEAGSGSTSFNGQGYQLTTNYHHPVIDSFSVIPYVGLRYTHLNTGGYTEGSNANVTLPLSYNSLTQNTFSAIGGLGFRVGLSENLTGTASIGIQQNLKYSMNNYQVTSSIIGLESFSVAMPGNVNSMATASAGLFYDINKRERLGLNILWQQQPFIATNTTTALMTYTIGY